MNTRALADGRREDSKLDSEGFTFLCDGRSNSHEGGRLSFGPEAPKRGSSGGSLEALCLAQSGGAAARLVLVRVHAGQV